MAYMSQERKTALAPAIKAILKEYGLKGSLGVRHYSTLVLNIKSGPIDFCEGKNQNYLQVNHYHIASHYIGKAQEALLKLKEAMNVGNHDNSDMQSDHVDIGWYIDINVGRWDTPYVFVKEKKA